MGGCKNGISGCVLRKSEYGMRFPVPFAEKGMECLQTVAFPNENKDQNRPADGRVTYLMCFS